MGRWGRHPACLAAATQPVHIVNDYSDDYYYHYHHILLRRSDDDTTCTHHLFTIFLTLNRYAVRECFLCVCACVTCVLCVGVCANLVSIPTAICLPRCALHGSFVCSCFMYAPQPPSPRAPARRWGSQWRYWPTPHPARHSTTLATHQQHIEEANILKARQLATH